MTDRAEAEARLATAFRTALPGLQWATIPGDVIRDLARIAIEEGVVPGAQSVLLKAANDFQAEVDALRRQHNSTGDGMWMLQNVVKALRERAEDVSIPWSAVCAEKK